jgi:DNA-binding HxlR family transcriptional regulator
MNLSGFMVSGTLLGMRTYGQYCPIARTSELFAERWTPILVRNLLAGCRTFGELMAGAPGISRALLAQRLELLELHGILVKETTDSGRHRFAYTLTDKGRELKAVTDAMGSWGARWLEVEPHHVDAAYVLWATCKLVDVECLPARGLVVRVDLSDRATEPLWMLLHRPAAEMCSTYLGWAEDLVVRTDSGTLAHWHLRHISYEEASRSGRLQIDGAPSLVKAFLRCLRPSPFAGTQPANAPR